MKILIYGLPGSGKTTYAEKMNETLKFSRLNGDDVRAQYQDWDFSKEGRIRQASRLRCLADTMDDVIIDFVAPLHEMRKIIDPDVYIWLDTIKESRYPDTNLIFEYPILLEDKTNNIFHIKRFGERLDMIVHKIKQYHQHRLINRIA